MKAHKRTIAVVVTSRVHYARGKLLLAAFAQDPTVALSLVVGGSALLAKYGNVAADIERDGFTINEKLYTSVEGGDNVAMAKTTGLAVLEFTTTFQRIAPDILVIRGDRFEILAAAIAAAYLNIPIAHIEGGDISGSIDESVRHAITKLAHIHFPTNEDSKSRILAMGENPMHVFDVGSLDVEFLEHVHNNTNYAELDKTGIGTHIDIEQPFVMVIQHPVTTEQHHHEHAHATLNAIEQLAVPTLWFWPNIDAGTDELSRAIRQHREARNSSNIRFIKNISPELFATLLKQTKCLVGNSSAGVKESSYLGTPVVNIGTRQAGRFNAENGKHIITAGNKSSEIVAAIREQFAHGPYEQNNYYYQSETSRRIVEVLKDIHISTQKRFFEHKP